MKTDPTTFRPVLERMLAKGLLFSSTQPGRLMTLPVVHAEVKGGAFLWACVLCEDERDVMRIDFDGVDMDSTDPETCRGFTLRAGGQNVAFGTLISDLGEENLPEHIRGLMRKEKDRPRILPFAKEVMAEWRI